MFDFRMLFGTFFASIGAKLTKKAYTNGLVIVTASIICVLFLGVNDFGFASVDREHSYNKSLDDDGVAIEEDEELMETLEGDEAFSLSTESTPFNGVLDFDQNNLVIKEKGLDNNEGEMVAVDLEVGQDVIDSEVESKEDEKEFVLQKETEDTSHFVSASAKGIDISKKDYEALLKIVEAEATGEDLQGKIMIANVIFNRVEASGFANTPYNVIHERFNGNAQFSPIDDGRYYTVNVTESTIEAVERAISGEDHSNGALFFVARKLASKRAVSWFDNNLNKVAAHGCHEFYDYY